MKLVSFIFMYILTFSNIYAKTINELVSKIANSKPVMGYSFWVAKDENSKYLPFLAKKAKNGYKVWHFTSTKDWQPVHNAGKIGNFPKADIMFEEVNFNKAKETITFGAINKTSTNEDINKKVKILENKEFKIGWYFWVKDKDPFLFKKKKNKTFSIWYFTPKKLWQPIHNASKSADFALAPKSLVGVSFDAPTGTLVIGKSLLKDDSLLKKEDKPSLPEGITLSSTVMKNGEFLDEKYSSSISPPLSWKVSNEIKKNGIIKSYAISLQDLDAQKYHWHMINIPSRVTSISKGPIMKYKNILNDFGKSSYMGPFPPTGETHTYEFRVYGFTDTKINGMQDYRYAIYTSSIKIKYTGK
jgi:Raf kinase inhibitor-like YbhB/YbcL family protein